MLSQDTSLITTGKVTKAFGNLVHADCDGHVSMGGIGYICISEDIKLKSEIVEISRKQVKLQCFEETYGIASGTNVEFPGILLDVELGPGLLGSVFDGLQNPLLEIKKINNEFITRGKYFSPLSKDSKWDFSAIASVGQSLVAGDKIGYVIENGIKHLIYLPPTYNGTWTISSIKNAASLTKEDVIAVVKQGDKTKELQLRFYWPIKQSIKIAKKVDSNKMMYTGIRSIDTFFPIKQGGTFCTPGPFGAGKTVLQHHFIRWCRADVVIVIACGERAGEITQVLEEMKELEDPITGRKMIDRTILICNTSSMPTASREASIYTGLTIAEYYMNMGLDVLCLADSTSRWAQALRELSGLMEEMPGEEAFPAYLGSRLAQVYERSGTFMRKDGDIGSITFGGTVSPSGGNFEEPVTQKTLSVAGSFLGLSRERAGARKFPAIDPIISWSKYKKQIKQIKGEEFSSRVERLLKVINSGKEIYQRIEVVGEEGVSLIDYVRFLQSDIIDFCFLQQNSFDEEDMYVSEQKRDHMLLLHDKLISNRYVVSSTDEAREMFSHLKEMFTKLRYLSFNSNEYKDSSREIYEYLKNQEEESIINEQKRGQE